MSNSHPSKQQKRKYLTVNELAERWRCGRRTIERRIEDGEISKEKDGHRTLISMREVLRYERKMRRR